MSEKINLAFFSPSAELKNGWGVVTASICRSLVEYYQDKVNLDLYLPQKEKNKGYIDVLPFAAQTHFILPEFAWSFRNPQKLFKYLTKKVLNKKTDVIHVLDFPYAGSAMANSRLSIPYTITLCGTFYKPLHKFPDHFIFDKTYRKAANTNAISDFTLDRAVQEFKIPQQKTSVIHAGVNFERFEKPGNVAELRNTYVGNKKIILGVGALKARKGFDVVIRAMEKIVKSVPNALYLIIGFGNDEGSLKHLVVEKGLQNHVVFKSDVSDAALAAYYHLADVYCHAPRSVGDAFPGFEMVYIEAGCAGKPVVGTRCGGTTSAVIDGETGFLVPENDHEAIADRLIQLLQDEALARRLGENNREYARKHDWKVVTGQYVELYEQITMK